MTSCLKEREGSTKNLSFWPIFRTKSGATWGRKGYQEMTKMMQHYLGMDVCKICSKVLIECMLKGRAHTLGTILFGVGLGKILHFSL